MPARQKNAAVDPDAPHPHHNHHRLEKIEGGMDYLMLAIIVALGLAMAIGLVTAGGNASWLR